MEIIKEIHYGKMEITLIPTIMEIMSWNNVTKYIITKHKQNHNRNHVIHIMETIL